MMGPAIALRRLYAQGISRPLSVPREAVHRLGAVQAQDRPGAMWAIGLRSSQSAAAVEEAVRSRTIVRTWLNRGTLHFVAAEDLRWMLKLLAPRGLARARRREEQLRLDDRVFTRSGTLLGEALKGEGAMTRKGVMDLLEGAGISTADGRGYHILWHLALDGLICFGPMDGREATFVLLDEWLPIPENEPLEGAAAALAERYFIGHGPATLRDFIWWSGLPASTAREAIGMMGARLVEEVHDGKTYWSGSPAPREEDGGGVHLLPAFDEYIVGYQDRSAVLDPGLTKAVLSNNGVFYPIMVMGGRIRGTWKAIQSKEEMTIEAKSFSPLGRTERLSLKVAAERYGEYMGHSVKLSIGGRDER